MIKKLEIIIKNNYPFYLSFLIPFFTLGFIFIGLGFFPFGPRSILIKDIYGQYIDFYNAYFRIFFNGESPFYSWSKGLGGNFWGIFSYYLSSPFSLFALLLPVKYLPESIALITLAKVGAAGLSFAFYLSKSLKAKGLEILIFSIPYALMSYILVFSPNIMWLDGIVFLPLIVLGIDGIIQGNSFIPYYLALTWMIIANYYIGYMLCIFSLLYFLYACVLSLHPVQIKIWAHRFLIFAFSSLLSAGSSAFLLFPTYFSLAAGKLDLKNPFIYAGQKNILLDILPKLLFASYDSALANLPNVYCGLVMVLLTLIYFVNRNIPLRHKIASASFLALMGLSFNTTVINLIWHGFQPPIWYFYRYSFIFSFLLIYLAYQSYKSLLLISRRRLLIALGLALLIILFVSLHGFPFLGFTSIVFSALLFAVYFVIFININKYHKGLTIFFCGVVLLEAGMNAWFTINSLDREFKYFDRVAYSRFYDQVLAVTKKIQNNDPGFYRIEKTFYASLNDPLELDYKGLTHDSSSFDQSTQLALKKLGFLQGGYQTPYIGSTIFTDSFLGLKYLLTKDPLNLGYQEIDRTPGKIADITTYQNPYALPLGFMVSPQLIDTGPDEDSPIQWQNQILRRMVGTTSEDYFIPLPVAQTKLENINSIHLSGASQYKKVKADEDGFIEYILRPANDDPLYAYLLAINESKVEVFVNASSQGFYGQNIENNHIISLGKFSQGAEVSIRLRLMSDSLTLLEGDQFYQLDMTRFSQATNGLSAGPLQITAYNDTQIVGKINVTGDNTLLFTSIPYDAGWNVSVDGKPAEKVKLLDAFIGINLSQGAHRISFFYTPSGIWPGCAISLLSLSIVIFFMVRKMNIIPSLET